MQSIERRPARAAAGRWAGALLATTAATAALAQQPDLGVAAVELRDEPYIFDTAEVHSILVTVIARGLAHPFALAFLPNGDALVTERGARLRLVRNAANHLPAVLEPQPVAGAPEPGAYRGVGLFDVAVHPRFADNRLVYFTYNKPGPGDQAALPAPQRQSQLVLARAVFDGKAMTRAEELFVGGVFTGGSGSRIAFGTDGKVYVTTGAPFGDGAQDLSHVYGKVLRLNEDGSIPDDNPFVGRAGAHGAVFSFGHRDQLGLTVHPSGAVLAAEHGPNGGDEVNLILAGRNYGWPKHTFGRNYDGAALGNGPVGEGIEPPLIVWLPSIAPTGLAVYTGEGLGGWKGNLFVGSARVGEIPRTGALERVVLNDNLQELRRERLLGALHQRIRDVQQGPDGLLYVITDEDDGALLRIGPANK
jgi:glucose/arabinose dehydrogenase